MAAERASRLRSEGLEASAYPALGPKAFRTIRAELPDAILIDLTELPSYGRTMAVLLRESKSLRAIPLVFLKGDPEKAARVRETIPDAVFAVWPNVAPAIERAIKHAPAEPALTPPSTSLAQRLRIREGAMLELRNAPRDIARLLGPLPEGVRMTRQSGDAPLILLFVKSAAALVRELPALAGRLSRGRTLWTFWPKRTSATPCDLTLPVIRDLVRSYDMIDSKICAVNETWSATAITRRRAR